ncbi:hypothetical protein KKA00_08960 [bacterium]|nr:hypothetical protein [bacterium]MBU1652337.1 hypothetical protein [bacterium]
MNISGWIMFLTSWVVFSSLVIFCYYKIFTARHPHLTAPLEIDTKAD